MSQLPRRQLFFSSFATALLFVTACSTLLVEQTVRNGRNALKMGQPDNAINYFSLAAESAPDYKTSHLLSESVWTYLGRAYYEKGRYQESRTALDKSLAKDNNDFVARLYLGMGLVRSSDRERGLAEMKTALNEMHQWLENVTSESSEGAYWDPNRQLRKTIETSLGERSTAIELVVMSQRIGKQLEEEIDRAEKDKIQSSYDTGSKN